MNKIIHIKITRGIREREAKPSLTLIIKATITVVIKPTLNDTISRKNLATKLSCVSVQVSNFLKILQGFLSWYSQKSILIIFSK